MAKNKISEFSSTSADNTDITNINIAEGCSPANLNNAVRSLMSILKNQQDGSSGDPFACTNTLATSGTLAVTGNVTLNGSSGTLGQALTSAGSGNTPIWSNIFVAGMIMLWSGSSATIPTGWLLCNGSNGTPDLRNRFVVGATSTYAVGATGGSADAIVVSHTHTATVTDPGHFHSYGENQRVQVGTDNGEAYDAQAVNAFNTNTKTTGITVSNSTTGSSGTNANLPPYYALCYIMKA